MDLRKLRLELTRDEGKRLVAYRDSRGFWTIGVGHLLGGSPRMSSITEDECTALLNFDINIAEDTCERIFGWSSWATLDDVRQRALVNMAFNRGEENMRLSKTITPAIKVALIAFAEEAEMWKKVTEVIKASEWASQVKGRADRLAAMLETGKELA